MADQNAGESQEYGLEALAKMRASLDLQDRERLDAALRSVRLAARERAQAAREEGRTDPDELRAEVAQLAGILRDTVHTVDTAEEVVDALELVAQRWRQVESGTAKHMTEDRNLDPSIVASDSSDLE